VDSLHLALFYRKHRLVKASIPLMHAATMEIVKCPNTTLLQCVNIPHATQFLRRRQACKPVRMCDFLIIGKTALWRDNEPRLLSNVSARYKPEH
jgi:hypothetical protein